VGCHVRLTRLVGRGASRQNRMVDGSGIIRTCEKRSHIATLAVPASASHRPFISSMLVSGINFLPNKVQEKDVATSPLSLFYLR
jgi:hypothetical protein